MFLMFFHLFQNPVKKIISELPLASFNCIMNISNIILLKDEIKKYEIKRNLVCFVYVVSIISNTCKKV